MATEGLVCNKCGELHVYWDPKDLDMPELWIHGLKASAPMACKICGIGEYKIVSDINPHAWCSFCGLPKKRCNCEKKDWADV